LIATHSTEIFGLAASNFVFDPGPYFLTTSFTIEISPAKLQQTKELPISSLSAWYAMPKYTPSTACASVSTVVSR